MQNSGLLSTGYFGGTFDRLNISGVLTNLPGSQMLISRVGDVVDVSAMNLPGELFIGQGAAVNLTNQAGGITDVPAGFQVVLEGSFVDFLDHTSGLGSLNSVEGNVQLFGENLVITPKSGTLTIASPANFELDGFPMVSSTVTVRGSVSNFGTLITGVDQFGGNRLYISGDLTNNSNATFKLNAAGDLANIGGTVTNANNIVLAAPGTSLTVGSLVNTAQVFIESDSLLTVKGSVNNSGFISTELTVLGNTISTGGLLTNSGTIVLQFNGDQLHAAGGLTNSGSFSVNQGAAVDTPFVNNLGSIQIDNASTFVVGKGSAIGPGYIQLPNGTLGEMISSSGFGMVNSGGPAILDGTLHVLLQGGFNPTVGSTYDFLTFDPGQLTGTFANIQNDIFNHGTESWLVTYDNADGVVALTAEKNSAIPEPGTFLLVIPGLIAASCRLRTLRVSRKLQPPRMI